MQGRGGANQAHVRELPRADYGKQIMSTATAAKSHSEQQAKAQCESILEMVRALNRETAAEDYVKSLPLPEVVKALDEAHGTEIHGELPEDEARELLASRITDESIEPDGFEFDEDEARERIQEDALSVEVRSDWQSLGEDLTPAEFCILLCTGGPAVRIIGDLVRGEPSRPRVQHQDWGTPWTEYFPTAEEREALQTYCQQFYFGE